MGKITKVPNGPLIKKKGPYAGSTLKAGGKVKKAQNGTSEYSDPKPLFDKIKKTKDSINDAKIKLEQKKFKSDMNYLNSKLKNEESMMNTKKVKKGQEGFKIGNTTYTITNDKTDPKKKVYVNNPIKDTVSPPKVTSSDRMNSIINNANKNIKKKKAGGMIKRADGSYSKRGLWDNIRANKGSGKKPTAAMLKQEKKIKAKTKK